MKISKLFAALLAVMLAVGAFGLSAFAGSVISTVEIKDLTEPVVGWEPEYNWAVVNQTEFTAVTAGPGGRWYESKDGKDYTLMPMGYESFGDGSRQFFKENNYYRFKAEYEPEQNCSWDEGNLTVKINGAAADYSISGKTLTVSKDFGPLTWEGLVSFVGITDVVTPKAGSDVSYSFKISEYSDVIASLAGAGARWDESSDGGLTWTALDPNQSSKFKEGCAYRFYIEVMAKSGSTLAGVIGATINNEAAATGTKLVGDDAKKVGFICKTFPTLGENNLTVKPADGEIQFYTYHALQETNAKVEVENANGQVNIQWFYCDALGEKTGDKSFGKGYSVMLKGIPAGEMMMDQYVLVTVQETDGAKRSCAAVIPYTLLPSGIEGDDEQIKVSVAQGEAIVVKEAGKPVSVEAVLENNISECSVDWFPCDSDGTPDRAHPLGNGYSIDLPAIDEKDAGKVFYYEVYAVDDRGYTSGGHLIFSVMLEKAEEVTPTPDGEEPTTAPDGTTKEPDAGEKTPENGETAEPEKTGEPSNGNSTDLNPLFIVLIVVGVLALCAICVLIGVVIGKKKN